jgi:hypothetical protein
VQTGLANISLKLSRDLTITAALSKICELIQGHWYLDDDNVLHLFTGDEAVVVPDVINDANQGLLLDPPITITEDISQIRTRIFVEGAAPRIARRIRRRSRLRRTFSQQVR